MKVTTYANVENCREIIQEIIINYVKNKRCLKVITYANAEKCKELIQELLITGAYPDLLHDTLNLVFILPVRKLRGLLL